MASIKLLRIALALLIINVCSSFSSTALQRKLGTSYRAGS